MLFESFPKIPRISRDCVITEKIDGTNACIGIVQRALYCEQPPDFHAQVGEFYLFAGKRNGWCGTGKQDNFGFRAWVTANAEELVKLGPGRHFGEWWGPGIQRGYGVAEKRFTLFNAGRWTAEALPSCVSVVPIIEKGEFTTELIDRALEKLKSGGSLVSPGFMRPEGIVIYHTRSGQLYKKLIEGDDKAKGDA